MCPRVTHLETKPVAVRLILRRCVVAVGAAAAAVLLRAALDPLWGSKLPLLTFGGAVMVSAWFGGLWPGLLTTALCALAIDYFWMAPTGSLAVADTGDIVALALFLLIGLLISGLNEALRRRLEAAAREAEGHAAERLRAEEERNRLLVKERAARQEAEEANRAKDEFLAILSHEVRTPLQSMLGWLALLRSGRLEARAARRALETIARNTRTQAQLIGDLLDVSRILAGKLRLDRRPVNLVRVVEAAIDAVRSAADARTIRVALARATEEPSPSAAPRLGGVRVLVVDDDPDTCELLSTVLRQDGAAVVTAPSAQEALKTCERLRPDVLVTDISMPGEDGYDLLRQVRDLERRRRWRIPAVALTAHAQAEARDEAFSAGFKAYMAKPVEPVDLTRAVAILSRRLDQS